MRRVACGTGLETLGPVYIQVRMIGHKHENNHVSIRAPILLPENWLTAGYAVSLRFTAKQKYYSHRPIGVSRFVYNVCVPPTASDCGAGHGLLGWS